MTRVEPPLLEVDTASPIPAYRQIANALRAHLVAGRFPPGTSLPTVRRLALDLVLNHNTVAEAYRLLAEEGWLDLRRAQGATVLDRRQPRAGAADVAAFARRLQELTAEGRASGVPVPALRNALHDELRRLDDGGVS
jgi:GntR family transcriptional regulator